MRLKNEADNSMDLGRIYHLVVTYRDEVRAEVRDHLHRLFKMLLLIIRYLSQ